MSKFPRFWNSSVQVGFEASCLRDGATSPRLYLPHPLRELRRCAHVERLVAINLMERKIWDIWNRIFSFQLLLCPVNLLKSSQFNFCSSLSRCHIPISLRLQIYESRIFFLQCCVQLWASKVFIKQAGLFWCRGRGDRWKAERSYQGLIKNQLIFINFICHC